MSESESDHASEDYVSDDSEIDEGENDSESEMQDGEAEPDGMYGNEPEYSDVELQAQNDAPSNSESDDESDDDLDSSRLENLHWCACGECSIMPTLGESKCCHEFATLLGEKLTDEVKCITKHLHFSDICLKTHILEASYIQHRRYRNNFADIQNIGNKNYRFTAYHQYSAWVHHYERLGKGNRFVLPACVVGIIRNSFPSADSLYTGYKEFANTFI